MATRAAVWSHGKGTEYPEIPDSPSGRSKDGRAEKGPIQNRTGGRGTGAPGCARPFVIFLRGPHDAATTRRGEKMSEWIITLEKKVRDHKGDSVNLREYHFTYKLPDGWKGKEADAFLLTGELVRADYNQRKDGTPINPSDLD